MKLEKQAILNALKTISAPGEGEDMVTSGAVTNVVTFGGEEWARVSYDTGAVQHF